MFPITPIPAFNDNYIWAMLNQEDATVIVVDPGDASAVEAFLSKQCMTLSGILVTHHHYDHTDGIAALTSNRDIPVYGPENSPFKGITQPLKDDDSLTLFGETWHIKAVPAHTLDHISYFLEGDTPRLFCGDTLFLAGCGRLFEGTPAQMHSAMTYFASLPDNTEVYCTHEYSLANLAFAAAVEPDNADIKQLIDDCTQLREQKKPTLPTSIEVEKRINPYMRTQSPAVIAAAETFAEVPLNSEIDVLKAIREWKNQF